MNNEQNGPGTDPLVSETYRELAGEKTPEALNREILRLAAKEGRTRFAVSRAWTRPLAWAATIALSLTLVLHLTDAPQPASQSIEPAADEDAAEIAARQDAGHSDVPASQPVPADRVEAVETGRVEASDVATLEESEPSLAKRSRAEMQQLAAKIEVANDRPVATGESPAAALENPAAEDDQAAPAGQAFAPTDPREHAEESMLDEVVAEEAPVSRSRQPGQRLAERPAAGVAAMSSMAVSADALGEDLLCPPEARETLKKWLDCIAEIEATTPPELVEREYEALRMSFPEFENPAR